MDRLRDPCNPIWTRIQTPIYKCFGQLATVAWGHLLNDDYLLENYIKVFNVEEEREKLKNQLEKLEMPKNHKLFLEFSRTHKNYIHVCLLKSFDDFDIDFWIASDKEVVLVLLGNKGVGKSTFIFYILKNLEQTKDIIVFANNLALVNSTEQALKEIYISLSKQIDEKVLEVGKAEGMDLDQILNERFYFELQSTDAVIKKDDDAIEKAEKAKRRSAIILEQRNLKSENSRDSAPYLRSGIQFLRSKKKRMCLILDDVDRIKTDAVAEEIREEAKEISHDLNIPVVLSLREVTARKIGNKFGNDNKFHILAPQFEDVLRSRLKTFENSLKENPPKELLILGKTFSVDQHIEFVRTVIKSILEKQENLFMFYMLSNSNIDLMLDYFKALLASSHLNIQDLNKIASGVLITQQKILETLLLYIYSEMNKENTYLLNLYDDDDVEEEFNNLFRIRLLQTICQCGQGNNDNKIAIKYSNLEFFLGKFGYANYAKKNLSKTIEMMRDFAIVETSIFGLDYDDNTEIILNDSAYYYINNLIFRYRYLQTIIPDTHLDYRADFLELKGDLSKIDKQIVKFINFIEHCEEKEPSEVAETFTPAISKKMRQGFEQDRVRQMKTVRH